VDTAAPLGRPIRAALLGFGLIVGVWLLTGLYFSSRMGEAARREATINARYMRAQELLAIVRAQVLLASVYVRDGLLDPDTTGAATYRDRLTDAFTAADRALEHYVPVLDSTAEQEQKTRLSREIDAFHQTLQEVLAADASRWPGEDRMSLRSRVALERERVMRLSEQTQTLNRTAFVQQQSALADMYGLTQRRIWQSLGFALAASLGIAFVAALYATRLEDRVRLQREKEAQNTRDLQMLSAKVLDAQEDERRHISRELHDEVGQVLTAIKVELALAQRGAGVGAEAGGSLDDARAMVEGAIQTVRDLSHLLHPAILDDLGLGAALGWHLKGFARRHAIKVELLQEGMGERLRPEMEVAVYRIVQEALTNVAKHAEASICRVSLQRCLDTLTVTVEDNGVGLDGARLDASRPRQGLGLLGIRERVAHLRGTLRLTGSPGKGTCLTIAVPVECGTVAQDANQTETAAHVTAVAIHEAS